MRGVTSSASKRRQQLIAEGKLPPETKDARRVVAGFLGAIGAGKLERQLAPEKQAIHIAEQRFGISLIAPSLEYMGRLVRGEEERAPHAVRLNAAQYLVDRYGRREGAGGDDAPLNEVGREVLDEAIAHLRNEVAKRSADEAEPAQDSLADQHTDAPPAESKP